ncbi:hypothetical protein [Mucilaginibacter defluvii]|uniref:Uncharacterized protein n=1 Tax=Mucilaginibacter defluvii TaxID=1196019 RepID=A0ABP9FME9_9SPHI
MKRLLLSLTAILAYFNSFSQEKFTGIGVFKIGSDSSVVYNYAEEKCKKVKVISSIPVFDKKYIAKISKGAADIIVDPCPDVSEYRLALYEVAGMKLKNVELTFYKNKLIKFRSDYSTEVVNALDQKYGKSESTIKYDTASCVYQLTGITRKLVAKTYHNNRESDDIHFSAFVGSYYDDKCNEQYYSGLSYSIQVLEQLKCSNEASKNKYTPKLKDEKQLKDL